MQHLRAGQSARFTCQSQWMRGVRISGPWVRKHDRRHVRSLPSGQGAKPRTGCGYEEERPASTPAEMSNVVCELCPRGNHPGLGSRNVRHQGKGNGVCYVSSGKQECGPTSCERCPVVQASMGAAIAAMTQRLERGLDRLRMVPYRLSW